MELGDDDDDDGPATDDPRPQSAAPVMLQPLFHRRPGVKPTRRFPDPYAEIRRKQQRIAAARQRRLSASRGTMRRQYMSRAVEERLQQAREQRAAEEAAMRLVLEESATLKLQAVGRGFFARRMIRDHRRAVTTLLRVFRRQRVRRRHRAAARIQALGRGWRARMQLRAMRAQRRAIVRIQALSRGRSTRRMDVIGTRRQHRRALLTVQAVIRGWGARTDLQRLKNWVQCFHPEERRVCFYNIRADHVQFHRPDEWYDEETGRALGFDYEAGCWQWQDADADDWVQCVDEERQALCYLNTDSGQVSHALPLSWGGSGWALAWHERERRRVFVAETTQEYREQVPSAFGVSRWVHCEDTCSGRDAYLCTGSSVTQVGEPPGTATCTAWLQALEPTLRVACFFRPETGETRWAPPESFTNDDGYRDESAAWVKCEDLRTRRRCYWNAVTRSGGWLIPSGHVTVMGVTADEIALEHMASEAKREEEEAAKKRRAKPMMSRKAMRLLGQEALVPEPEPEPAPAPAPPAPAPAPTTPGTSKSGGRVLSRGGGASIKPPVIEMGAGIAARDLTPMIRMPGTLPPRLRALGLLNADGQYGPPEDASVGGPPRWPRVTLGEVTAGMEPRAEEPVATTMLRTKLEVLVRQLFLVADDALPSLSMVSAARRLGSVPMPLSFQRRPVTAQRAMPLLPLVRECFGHGDDSATLEETMRQRAAAHAERLRVTGNVLPGSNRRTFVRLLGMTDLAHPAIKRVLRPGASAAAAGERRRLTVAQARAEAAQQLAEDDGHSPGIPEMGQRRRRTVTRNSSSSLRAFAAARNTSRGAPLLSLRARPGAAPPPDARRRKRPSLLSSAAALPSPLNIRQFAVAEEERTGSARAR